MQTESAPRQRGRHHPHGVIRDTVGRDNPRGDWRHLGLIDHAQPRLGIIDPQVADGSTLDRIMPAARRGLHVRFIVPQPSNASRVQWAFEHHQSVQDLQDAAVLVYWHPTLPHACPSYRPSRCRRRLR